MLEKGRITPSQMAFFIFGNTTVTQTLSLPRLTGPIAGRDLWLSSIWGSLAGIIALFLAVRLHHRYPRKTIIQYFPHILGNYVGKGVGLFYLFALLTLMGANLYQYTDFVKTVFLPQTPAVIIMASLLLACCLAARGGLETVARTIQLVGPLGAILFIILLGLTVQAWDVGRLFPVLEEGILPTIKGGMISALWFSEFFLISFLLPNLVEGGRSLRWGFLALFATFIFFILTDLIVLMVFDVQSHIYNYPLFEALRYISYADFFEHLDALAMGLWILGFFTKTSFLFYITVLGTAQWLNLSSYKLLVWPLGFLSVILGMWTTPTVQGLFNFLSTTGPWYFIFFLVVIPAVLLFVSTLRKQGAETG